MLTVISPAKKMNFDAVTPKIDTTLPAFQADAYSLSQSARRLSALDLQKLMKISPALAKLNQERFNNFSEDADIPDSKAAILAFSGDTYIGLDAESLEAEELHFAQEHLRIISGLYGLLRPMDRIQPYRLEMGSRLATRKGKNLYQYWGDRLALELNKQADQSGSDILLNCASVEYFKAVSTKSLKPRVITPVFMEERDGTCKTVGLFAKRARGAMARFAIQNRIFKVDSIKDFDSGGYVYRSDMSEGDRLVFTRDYPEN